MKRYIALAIDVAGATISLDDTVGQSDNLADAKRLVDLREDDGFNVYEIGAVFDTKTGEIRDWKAALSNFGDDTWFAPRSIFKD